MLQVSLAVVGLLIMSIDIFILWYSSNLLRQPTLIVFDNTSVMVCVCEIFSLSQCDISEPVWNFALLFLSCTFSDC
jgi:hypothetical protein